MSDQIKMFIAGEEVVSQNEFTINEEMLSASSTILNNCYPKSWELTKDYISNFYYPKDYSRFVLAQGEYLHGNNEFEPLEITSKNLFDMEYETVRQYNASGNQVNNNYFFNGDIITINYVTDTFFNKLLLEAGTYTIQYIPRLSGTGKSVRLRIRNFDNLIDIYSHYLEIVDGNVYSYTFTLASQTTIGISIMPSFIDSGELSLENIQLEKNSVATVYEPYNQPTLYYETNVEKEWNNLIIDGRTYQKARSGKNLLNYQRFGTFTTSIQFITISGLKQNTNYTLSSNLPPATDNPAAANLFLSANQSPSSANNGVFPNNARTINTGSNTTLYVGYRDITNSYIDEATNYWYQLEENSEATFYEQYGIMPSPDYPSELISVGYENLIKIKDNLANSTIGLTYSYDEENNEVSIKGTPTRSYDTFILNKEVNLEVGNYIFFIDKALPFRVVLYHTFEDNTTDTITMTPGMTSVIRNFSKKVISFRIGATVMATGTAINETFKIQFEKGNKAHSYIPYGKYGIEVKTTGKNLFDEIYPSIETSVRYKAIYVGEGTFTMSTTMPYASTYTNLFFLTGNVSSGASTGSNGVWNARSRTITSTNGYVTVGYRVADNISPKNYNTQIEKGTQKTTYEEYKSNTYLYQLNEPLRAIGNIKDRLYYESGYLCVERKIGSIDLSTISWSTYGHNVSGYHRYSTTTMPNIKYVASNQIIGNGKAEKYIITNGSGMSNKINMVAIDVSQVSISAQASPTGEFIYELATPKIETYGKLSLPSSYEMENNVNIYTGLNARSDIWYYWKNYDVLFAGVVKNSGDISLNPRHPHYCSLQILDYKTFLSESNTLDFVIADKTVAEAINMVVNAVSGYGFIVGNINIDSANDIIGAYSTLNKTAYDVLQYLAEISGSRWRTRVVDSLTMAIDFYDPDNLPQADDIEYTKEYWEENNIVDMTFNYGTRDYRNKQVLLSDEVYANIEYDETLISNGYSNTFTLQNNIGDIRSVVVDGAEKTIGTNNDKQMGVEADFYYTPGKNIVESNSIYSAGTMIHLTYQPLVKGRQVVYNNTEVDRIKMQTQTEGVIARYETRNDVLSSDELEKIAKTYIEYKGKAEVIITVRTQNKDLYDIGEVVYFNAPIEDLAQDYMVKSKKTEYVVIDKIINLFYVYEMTSSFNSEKAINYFDNQRNKASGNIQEGESITRNVDIETQANIIWSEGSVSSTTVVVTGDNVLNCALNSPFVE